MRILRSMQPYGVIAGTVILASCGGGHSDSTQAPVASSTPPAVAQPAPPAEPPETPFSVQKATCGSSDTPESGLQGQVPASLRAAGFKGFNCNLKLVGQSRGDGASWQHAWFADGAGRKCNYYDTSSSTANRTQLGVVVVNATDPANPVATTSLTSKAMLDPWESLKVNHRRQMLAANNGLNGLGGPEVDVYDLSGDCSHPQLLSSTTVGKADGTTGVPSDALGHEGAWAPDGLTYYTGSPATGKYYALDMANATAPKMLGSFLNPMRTGAPGANGVAHGLSVSDDGNRAYMVAVAYFNKSSTNYNGLIIADTSEVQARVPNPTMKQVGSVFWADGAGAQMTIPVKIKGKPYIINVDELGGGNIAGWQAACDANMIPFGIARIVDVADETKPTVVSKLILESNDPKNCSKVLPDLAGLSGFTYDTHYCSVDNRDDATTLACANFEAGIRVYDIRDPVRVKEIAYFNPPAVTTPSPGSQMSKTVASGRPDHCSAQIRLDAATGTLQTTCQDNGFLSLKFENGVWPFPESTTPAGRQN